MNKVTFARIEGGDLDYYDSPPQRDWKDGYVAPKYLVEGLELIGNALTCFGFGITDNPFFSSWGRDYSNDVFLVRAFEDSSSLPNFEYEDLRVWWGRYLSSDRQVVVNFEVEESYVVEMVRECIREILAIDFKNVVNKK